MAGLPAVLVSGIATLHVLFVLILERLCDVYIGTISRDNLLLPKLTPIILIVLGLLLITLS